MAIANAIATPLPTPTRPLPFVINRARWRMYRLCVERLARGRRNVAPATNGAQGPRAPRAPRGRVGLLRPRQQLMLQFDDVDERINGVEVGEFHPAPSAATRHRTVAHRLPQDLQQTVGHGELALLALAQDEGP